MHNKYIFVITQSYYNVLFHIYINGQYLYMDSYTQIVDALNVSKSEKREAQLQKDYSDLAGERQKRQENIEVRAELDLPVSLKWYNSPSKT